uniref:Uncharacterized protein n=1 Tax=Anopheles culicifacies TaxID=139723 RepID=A0A182MS28_9DIPT
MPLDTPPVVVGLRNGQSIDLCFVRSVLNSLRRFRFGLALALSQNTSGGNLLPASPQAIVVVGVVVSVQENDGSYFESFTALSWKSENRRLSAVRAVETRAEILPENDTDRLLEDDIERSEQKEHLYLDVLYAIANTVGAPAPGGQLLSDDDDGGVPNADRIATAIGRRP